MGPFPFFYGFFPLARAPKESKRLVKENSPSHAEKASALENAVGATATLAPDSGALAGDAL